MKKRILSFLITLALLAGCIPECVLAGAVSSDDWTVSAFGDNGFYVYRHTAADSSEAEKVTDNVIDTGDFYHIYASVGTSYCGLAMMRLDSESDPTLPHPGSQVTDRGYYELSSSTFSSSGYTYFLPGEASTDFEHQYADGTYEVSAGMPLEYLAGSDKQKQHIAPGYYRFVYFGRAHKIIRYSDVYRVTDDNGICGCTGTVDASFTDQNGTKVDTLLTDGTYNITFTGFKTVSGDSVGALEEVSVYVRTNNYYGAIPADGSDNDSICSYEFDKERCMYDGKEYADGRSLETSDTSLILKNCTPQYISSSSLVSMADTNSDYKYRFVIKGKYNGRDYTFLSTDTAYVEYHDKNAPSYEVVYKSNYPDDEENLPDVKEKKTKGRNYLIKGAGVFEAPSGYEFDHWCTDKDDSGDKYAAGAKYTKDEPLTVYAMWRKTKMTVNFFLNGGAKVGDYEESIGDLEKGDPVELPPAPSFYGYTFDGWGLGETLYQPGEFYTVETNANFVAKWNALPDLTIRMPDELTEVAGQVCLAGVKGDRSVYLYSDDRTGVHGMSDIILPACSLGDNSYDGLELSARVDGESTVIAKYNGTVSANNPNTDIHLESGTQFTVIKAFSAEGLKEGADYRFLEARFLNKDNNKRSVFSIPANVSSGSSSFEAELMGVSGSPEYMDYYWNEFAPAELDDGILKSQPRKIERNAVVSGTVKYASGDPVKNVNVTVTQRTDRFNYTLSAVTDDQGRYSVEGLVPGVYSYVTAGRSGTVLASVYKEVTAHTACDLTVNSVCLETDIKLLSASDEETLLRYLRYRRVSLDVTGNDGKNVYEGEFSMWNPSAQESRFISGLKDSDTLKVSVDGDFFETPEPVETKVRSGYAGAAFQTKLKPGVVVPLSSQVTGQYVLAWYDKNGAFLSKTERFSLYDLSCDITAVCPDTTDRITLVLVPESYSSILGSTSFKDLPSVAVINTWEVKPEKNTITILDRFDADQVSSYNSAYVTKPASTATASAESYATADDLIKVTGNIGLDAGLKNGKLNTLYISSAATLNLKNVTINGKNYPRSDFGLSGDSYVLSPGKDGIALPATYTVYAKPGDNKSDMIMNINADINYVYGKNSLGFASREPIGNVRIRMKGAALTTLSTYVCEPSVTVTGVGERADTVRIYDNGELVGEAETNEYTGKYSAQIPLLGIDESDDGYASAHVIHSEGAHGNSEDLIVIHSKTGPQLTSFTMEYRLYRTSDLRTVNVGDSYSVAAAMYDTAFEAKFKNADKLIPMEDWGDDPVVFKVYTEDGEKHYYPAVRSGDTFRAEIGTVMSSAVRRAEVLYRPSPAKTRNEYVKDSAGDITDVITHEGSERTDELSVGADALRGYAQTLAAATSADDFDIDFSKTPVTVSGKLPVAAGTPEKDIADYLAVVAENSKNAGLTLKNYSVSFDTDETYFDWLDRIGREKFDSQTTNFGIYSRSNIFADKAGYEGLKKDVEKLAPGTHVGNVFENGITLDQYTMEDMVYDEIGNPVSGTYMINAVFYADETVAASPVYMATFTALLGGEEFDGYDLPENEAPAGAQRPVRSLSYTNKYLDGTYAQYHGNYQEKSSYKSGTFHETGSCHVGALSTIGGGLTNFVAPGVPNPGGAAIGWVGWGFGVFNTYHFFRNHDHRFKTSLELHGDLFMYSISPCYWKLPIAKRELCKNAVANLEKKAEKLRSADTWNLFTSGLCNVTGTALQFVPGATIVGMGVSGAGWIFSNTVGNNAVERYNEMIQSYNEEYDHIRRIFRAHAVQTGDDDCLDGNDGNGSNNSVVHDPSGIVYEGVIQNPVDGASVELYYAADDGGALVKQEDASEVKELKKANDLAALEPGDGGSQITGENGRYQWFVPEGLWYVKAKSGKASNDSSADIASAVSAAPGMPNLLPVLPVQLDVNIPLVDKTVPKVSGVRYTDDGVFVTFSKYMKDDDSSASVLNPDNYTLLSDSKGKLKIKSIVPVEQGNTPGNRTDEPECTYSRTVKIVTAKPADVGDTLYLNVKGDVTSYAGVPMGYVFIDNGTCCEPSELSAPVFAGTDRDGNDFAGTGVKKNVKRNAVITIAETTYPEGTRFYYTDDGSAVLDENGDVSDNAHLYDGCIQIPTDSVIRAVAQCVGYDTSDESRSEFNVTGSYRVIGKVYKEDGRTAMPGTALTLKGLFGEKTATAAADGSFEFKDIPDGMYKLSYGGDEIYRARSIMVNVAYGDSEIDMVLQPIKVDEEPVVVKAEDMYLPCGTVSVKEGEKISLAAIILPEGATERNVQYVSEDPAVAAVSGDGTLSGIKSGMTTINATLGELTSKCRVTVVSAQAAGYEPDDMGDAVKEAQLQTLTTEPVSLTIGEKTTDVSVTLTYKDAALYNGSKINAENDLSAKLDLSALGSAVFDGERSQEILQYVTPKFKCGKNKNASLTKPYMTVSLKTNNRALKKSGLGKQDIKNLKKWVKTVNKKLKGKKMFVINKLPVTMGYMTVEGKKKKKSIKVKKITVIMRDGREVKLKPSAFKIKTVDLENGVVRLTGKKNLTGAVSVGVQF